MLPIVRFAVLYLIATSVAFNLVMVFARQAGYELWQMCVYSMLAYAVPVMTIPFIRRLDTQSSFTIALATSAAGLVCLSFMQQHLAWYWIMAPCLGSKMVSFWVVYLTRQVTAGPARANAYNSSLIVAIQFGTTCITPLIAGQLGDHWGTSGVMLGGLAFGVVALTQVRPILPGTITLRLRSVWPQIPVHARLLLVFQGMIEATQYTMLPICTTTYLTSPMRFGLFFSVVALVGSTANLIIGRWSDRVGNRSRMIYIGCTIMVLGALGLSSAHDLLQWSLFAGAFQIGFTMALPYFLAVTLDASPTAEDAFVVREWSSNGGRIVTMLVGILLLSFTGEIQHVYLWVLVPLVLYMLVLRGANRPRHAAPAPISAPV